MKLREKIEELLGSEKSWTDLAVTPEDKVFAQDTYRKVVDQLLELFDTTVREIIGEQEDLHAKKDGTLPDEGIKNLLRNELRKQQLSRLGELLK